MKEGIHIISPATVANVGPGFDILGYAMDDPGDEIRLEPISAGQHEIVNQTEVDLPLDPGSNVSTVAMDSLLEALGASHRFRLTFLRKIPPGSGIGSSAASAAGAVWAVNRLLDEPCAPEQLVAFAMSGEALASGSAHADNVAPCIMGGIILVRCYDPLDLVRIPCPASLYSSVVFPAISIATQDSRKILKTNVLLKTCVKQSGNVGGLITGLITSDYRLIRDSMQDLIAEPIRSFLIPEFDKVKAAALEAGALGCSISGSGPSMFALSQEEKTAHEVSDAMKEVFRAADISSQTYVSPVNHAGIREI